MANDTIERLRYYQRQYLGAEDFTEEQEYHRSMRRRHNIGLHAWGIVTGLELVAVEPEGGGGSIDVYVMPGLAVDGFGREILVLEPHKVESALLQPFRKQAGMLGLWIGYAEELGGRPRPGFELCDTAGQLGRVRETFRLAVAPREPTHDTLVVAGHPVEPGAAASPADPTAEASERLSVPADESVPHQELPDDEDQPRWLVRLGNLTWDGLRLVAGAAVLNLDRRYVRVVAEEVMAPGGQLKLRHRLAPDPLPDTGNFYEGAAVEVQGSLTVRRLVTADQDLHVGGKAGIGTTDPKVKLHVTGGTNATLAATSGFVVVGPTDGENLVCDGNEIQARNKGAVAPLHLQANGGDLMVHQKQSDAQVVIKDGTGRVGIGGPDPKVPLHVLSGTDAELAEEESGFLVVGPTNGPNLVLDSNEIMARYDGSKATLHLQVEGGDLMIHGQVVVKDDGKVGVGTSAPQVRLHVEGGTDVDLSDTSSGFLVLGSVDGENVVFDSDEIQARTGGGASRLHLQRSGGALCVHYGEQEELRFVVNYNGFVGVGVQYPHAPLHVRNRSLINTSGSLLIGAVDGLKVSFDNQEIQARNDDDASTLHLQGEGGGLCVHHRDPDVMKQFFISPDGFVGIGTNSPDYKLDVRGDVQITGELNPPSDLRLKRDVQQVNAALAAVRRLRGVRFTWDREHAEQFGFPPGPKLGFVAQEVEEVLPEVVGTGTEGYKTLRPLSLLPFLVEAIKELAGTVEGLEHKVRALEDKAEGKA